MEVKPSERASLRPLGYSVFLVLGLFVLLFFLSSDRFSFEQTEEWLGSLLSALGFQLHSEDLELVVAVARKGLHVLFYGMLALGAELTIRRLLPMIAFPQRAIFVMLFIAVSASFDEMHQRTFPSRGGSWLDVVLDLGAAALALIAVALTRLYRKRNSTADVA